MALGIEIRASTNEQEPLGNASGVLVRGGGTAGTPSTSVMTVQGVTSGTPVQVQGTASMTPLVSVGAGDVIQITPTLDIGGAYADGNLLFDTTALAAAARVTGGRTLLLTVTVLDKDDEGAAFDLYFLNTNTSMGSLRAAPNISDANAEQIIGRAQVVAGDYTDIGGAKVAYVTNINALMESSGGSTIYVAGVARAAVTYTATTDLVLKFGFAYLD